MKKKTTLSIEENVLNEATKRIPNISGFVEECLKQLLGMNPGNYPTHTAHDLIDNIGKNQVELHILNEQNKIEVNLEKMEQEKIDRFWREIYLKYRETYILSDEIIEQASDLLEVDSETLEEIMDKVDDNNKFFNTWKEAKQYYEEDL